MLATTLLLIAFGNVGCFLLLMRGASVAHAALFILLTVIVGTAIAAVA